MNQSRVTHVIGERQKSHELLKVKIYELLKSEKAVKISSNWTYLLTKGVGRLISKTFIKIRLWIQILEPLERNSSVCVCELYWQLCNQNTFISFLSYNDIYIFFFKKKEI